MAPSRTCCAAAANGAANRVFWKGTSTRRARSAAAIISSASATVHAIGLSTSTCLPALSAAIATAWCCAFGVAMTTPSTSSRPTASSQRSSTAPEPHAAQVASDGRERSAREHGDLCTRRPQRRKVDVVGGGAAADDCESNGHERCCSASLRTVVPTCSQSASEYATPTGTMSDRPTSASVCGHRPGPYSRAVG